MQNVSHCIDETRILSINKIGILLKKKELRL